MTIIIPALIIVSNKNPPSLPTQARTQTVCSHSSRSCLHQTSSFRDECIYNPHQICNSLHACQHFANLTFYTPAIPRYCFREVLAKENPRTSRVLGPRPLYLDDLQMSRASVAGSAIGNPLRPHRALLKPGDHRLVHVFASAGPIFHPKPEAHTAFAHH